jgi:outer membrane lipoprotein-sorting protein
MLILITLCLTTPVLAEQPDGNAIMRNADDVTNKFHNLNFDSKVTTIEKNGDTKVRKMRVWQKGEMRLSKFFDPPRDRGMAFLALDDTNNFIYLPAFKKVRRIAAHVRNQNVMGTDLTYEDSTLTRYADDYTATVMGETDTQWKLELTPLPSAKVSYLKLHVFVNKARYTFEQVDYFNKKGEKIKFEIRDQYKNYHEEYWFPHRIAVTSLKDKHKTIMENSSPKYDENLPDHIFTTRNLKREVYE